MYKLKFLKLIGFAILISSCANQNENTTTSEEVCVTENLGLSNNNSFPLYPVTDLLRGVNLWQANYVSADTLVIMRSLHLDTDSSVALEYKFLAKDNECLVPISAKRTYYTGIFTEDQQGNIVRTPPRVEYKKPIQSLKIQHYQPHKLLACIVEHEDKATPNPPIRIEKMWIKLP